MLTLLCCDCDVCCRVWADPDSDLVLVDGITRLCEDLDVSPQAALIASLLHSHPVHCPSTLTTQKYCAWTAACAVELHERTSARELREGTTTRT